MKRAIVAGTSTTAALILRSLRNTARVYGNAVARKAIAMERDGETIETIGPVVSGGRGRTVYETGDLEAGIWSAGTSMGLIDDAPTCRELIERIIAEAEAIIRGRLAKAIAA